MKAGFTSWEKKICYDERHLVRIKGAVHFVEGFLDLGKVARPAVDVEKLSVCSGTSTSHRKLRYETFNFHKDWLHILALTGFSKLAEISSQSMSKTYKIISPLSSQGVLLPVHRECKVKIDNVVQCLGTPKCSHGRASRWRSRGADLHRFLP